MITDYKKLKNSLFMFTTSFVEIDELVKRIKMVGWRGTQHVISEAYIFLVGRKVMKNVKSMRVLTLCSGSTDQGYKLEHLFFCCMP